MDIHRRSSAATDVSLQNNQPVFVSGSSFDSTHSLAMSAPANMGYEYTYNPLEIHGNHHGNTTSNQSGGHGLAKSYEDDYTAQLNMQIMMEKRRRRRESHNAVERRRRDNINDRIQELCSLLPEKALENISLGPNNKPNKGIILKKSVDHIRYLQQEVQSYHQKVADLEKTLKMYQS
ncbi:Myc-type, basic helix-loop-helix domain-containing protein [Gilbertella persicaria]|uniref:Myc-type, basic helix-loop-helix domain-containing protein n=1 Tax=Gilbertella persicaria TaxID=101096 RepID=UPI00221F8AA4|nr:Myc-type, basic helix-loop-helix domain-containing protein [Gilbertella persicaria]KAI8086966.1 Myc-type, basic helix-loop-helix domain-containing protein [Gilbertella persicaria]